MRNAMKRSSTGRSTAFPSPLHAGDATQLKAIHWVKMNNTFKSILIPKGKSSTSLDMSGGRTSFTVTSKENYVAEKPVLPILRVFAAFEDTVTWPKMDEGRLGNYPLARLSEEFMQFMCGIFPSFKVAADAAKERNHAD
ncbi:hypothetical protein EXIGLDRAFT_761287 [Exidia glandulosa HHB12029]|uniref:Uncharacterized protein n=1 Tax=Exidia glandulosa HHB12029 TaxID=1314781 RepID=A0A165NNU0_EXIGL|nr:hypothetical protein EXIGLDRAFT_761287 [Exidia glandulosa HHB12029]